MATNWYMDKLGADTNAGTALSPFRNFSKVHSSGASGDSCYIGNGIYQDTEIEVTGGAGYTLFTKLISLIALNPAHDQFGAAGGARNVQWQPRVNTAVLRWNMDMSTANLVMDGIRFGPLVSGAAATYTFLINNTVSTPGALTVQYCTFGDVLFNVVNMQTGVNLNVNFNFNWGTLTAPRALVYLQASTNANVVCNDNNFVHLGASSALSGLVYAASSTLSGVTVQGRRNTHSMDVDSAAGAGVYPNFKTVNIDNVSVTDNNFTGTTQQASNSGSYGIVVTTDTAGQSAIGAIIYNNTVNCQGNGGVGIMLGNDATAAFDDTAGGLVYFNRVIGSAKFQAGTGHGILLGNTLASSAYANRVRLCGLGIVAKSGPGGANASSIAFNVVSECSGSYVQLKGAQGCRAENNTIIFDSSNAGTGLLAVVNTAENCGACRMANNLLVATGNTPSVFLQVDASQVVTLERNNYWWNGLTGTNKWSVAGSSYTDFPTYAAARETTALNIDPQLDSNFRLPAGNALIERGRGVVPNIADYYLKQPKNPPDIGAVSYQPGPRRAA